MYGRKSREEHLQQGRRGPVYPGKKRAGIPGGTRKRVYPAIYPPGYHQYAQSPSSRSAVSLRVSAVPCVYTD